MKKIYTLLFFLILIFSGSIYSQVPKEFKYQAVLKNVEGKILSDSTVNVKVEILKSLASGEIVFTEDHTVTTNMYGVFDLVIGSENDMSGIDWNNDDYFIQISLNNSVIAVGKFNSIPYSLFAAVAGTTSSADYNSIAGKPDFSNWDKNAGDDFTGNYDSLSNKPVTISPEQIARLDSLKLSGSADLDKLQADVKSNYSKVSFPGFGDGVGKAFVIIWSEINNCAWYNNGNVGIGVSGTDDLSTAKLHLGGGIRYDGDPSDTTAGLLYYDPAGTGFFFFYDDNGDKKVLGASSVSLSFNNIYSQDVVMHRNLAVGAGAKPGYDFGDNDLVFANNIVRLFFYDTSVGTFPSEDWTIEINDTANNGRNYFSVFDQNTGTHPFMLSATDSAKGWYVGSDGKTGLGAVPESNRLYIPGTVKAAFTGNISGITNLSGMGTAQVVNSGSTTIAADDDSDGNGAIVMKTSDTTRMSISSNGEVYIGTGVPGKLLSVAGDASVSALTVKDNLTVGSINTSVTYDTLSTAFISGYVMTGKSVVFVYPNGIDVSIFSIVSGSTGQKVVFINLNPTNVFNLYPGSIHTSSIITLQQYESATLINNGTYWECTSVVKAP